MLSSFNGTPLILECIKNEVPHTPDFSKPWPLKTLMDMIIEQNQDDILYVKDDYNDDLIVNAFQNNRIKSFNTFMMLYFNQKQ